MTIKVGINPLTWTNDDLPSLGADTSLEQCLSEGKKAGYAGFELGNKFPRQSEQLNSVLAEHDLKLVSGWFSGQLLSRSAEEEIIAIEDHLQLLKKGGSNVMVYCEVTGAIHGKQAIPLSHRPTMQAAEWEQFGKQLTQVADYCLSQGVRLAYHHHMGTVVETSDDIDLLMQHTGDSLGLLLDSGHITYANGDPLAVVVKHGKRIVHVHTKDVRLDVLKDAKNRNLSFLDAVLNGVFTVPGDGDIDYKAIFTALRELNYQGWLVVEAEQDPAIADPLTYATLGFNNIQDFARKANLKLA
ncbi:myo-inosose-2 dehydratase [Pseudoalteromonas sp. 5-MNA-CIBAN-0065]|uniref:myo-inosose-2 dehydratase n=1 Tax=Pseudoalteromonas sp. 5-MNA-CIBAN-0065 TaxID=3140421 RepID=UPI003325055C|tara:strand:+ start:13146 stop:14042 length:897 start_codon:yes stop_codon:yes gene_type:complete